MILEHLRLVAELIGLVGAIGGSAFAIVKTFRELKDGIKCLLRADMMSTYYKHHEDNTIREYEKQNFKYEYSAYKALGGNSFIDDINEDVKHWEVIP